MLFILLIITSFMVCDVEPKPKRHPKIVGGNTADPTEYPWQVLLYYYDLFAPKPGFVYLCGGSLIETNVVLSAAHCFEDDPTPYLHVAVFGEFDRDWIDNTEQYLGVIDIIMHSEYDTDTIENDIALVVLNGHVNLSESVSTVPLSNKSLDLVAQKKTSVCYISGFGISSEGFQIFPSQIQELETRVMSHTECLKKYHSEIKRSMVCTSNRRSGVCNGDSGGPMGCYLGGKFYQVGIVSFSFGRCIRGMQVFTRVAYYRQWIREYLPPPKNITTPT